MLRIWIILFLSLCSFYLCHAQTHGVVADMDLRIPLRDVTIHTNTNENVKTNYLGQFTLTRAFTSATITCNKYLSLSISKETMERDTIFLLPKMSDLDEVVVYGKAPKIGFEIKSINKDAIKGAQNKSGMAFDFANIFERFNTNKRYVSRKKRQKQKEILDNY